MTYYREELEKVNLYEKLPATIKICSGKGNTKSLNINPSSSFVLAEIFAYKANTEGYNFTTRAFHVTYMPATNGRGSRVKIEDLRFKESVRIPFTCEYNDSYTQAQDYLKSIGINIISLSEAKKGYILTTRDFDISIKTGKKFNF